MMSMETHRPLCRSRQRVIRGVPQWSLIQQASVCQQDRRRLHEALSLWRQAYQENPLDENTILGYAKALFRQGQTEESLRVFQQGLLDLPDTINLLFSYLWHLHYLPGPDRAFFYRAYSDLGRRWTQGFAAESPKMDPHALQRPLRVGILAGDFLENAPIGHFAPIWKACDRSQVYLVGYSNVTQPDAETAAWTNVFDTFHDVSTLTDAQAAATIRSHNIDILIAFGGYCGGHRVGVLRFRPAPLQMDMGSISTLGLPQVDVRIMDVRQDPPASQPWIMERLAYLPHSFAPYQPPSQSPLVSPLPALTRGYMTFGSFNNQMKINDTTLSWWGRIFATLPTARLLLKFPDADDTSLRAHMLHRLTAVGISAERVDLWGGTTHFQHLNLLQQADMLLDTYPFNGGRTTLEGMWMGVPTVTLAGDLFVARMGMGILEELDLGAFVATSPEAYISKACDFSGQLAALASIRKSLRGWLLASSICNPQQYAQAWVALLRQCWQEGEGRDD